MDKPVYDARDAARRARHHAAWASYHAARSGALAWTSAALAILALMLALGAVPASARGQAEGPPVTSVVIVPALWNDMNHDTGELIIYDGPPGDGMMIPDPQMIDRVDPDTFTHSGWLSFGGGGSFVYAVNHTQQVPTYINSWRLYAIQVGPGDLTMAFTSYGLTLSNMFTLAYGPDLAGNFDHIGVQYPRFEAYDFDPRYLDGMDPNP